MMFGALKTALVVMAWLAIGMMASSIYEPLVWVSIGGLAFAGLAFVVWHWYKLNQLVNEADHLDWRWSL